MAQVSGTEYVYSDTSDATSGARRRVIEDVIYSQDPIELPLRDYFGGYEKFKAKGIKFEIVEQNHPAIASTIATANTGWNTGSDKTGLSVADGDVFMVGDIILTANGEVCIVSDVDESGNTVDVYARGDLGSTESNANSDGDAIYIIGNAQLEGYTYGSDVRWTTRTTKANYTQIFHDTLSVSKSYQEMSLNGVLAGIKDEVKNQLKQKTLRLAKLLERNSLYGGANTGTLEGSSSAPRTMSGIIAPGTGTIDIQTNTQDLSSADITESVINTQCQNIYDNGGKPDTILVNSNNKKLISDFMSPYRRADFDDKKYGGVVSTYENDFGLMSIVLNRYQLKSDIIILPKKNFQFACLRPFKIIDLPDNEDSYRQEIVGEYSVHFVNEEHSAHIYNTSTS